MLRDGNVSTESGQVQFVGLGLLFFFLAIALLLITRLQDVATISVIAGALVEVISGVNFYLYNRSSAQLAVFHRALDQTQRFLLANTICELLDTGARDKARTALVRTIAERSPNQ
jgi:hypothetical protein